MNHCDVLIHGIMLLFCCGGKYLQLEGKVKAVGKTVHECFIT